MRTDIPSETKKYDGKGGGDTEIQDHKKRADRKHRPWEGTLTLGTIEGRYTIFVQRLTFSGFLDFFVKLNYGGD